MKRDNQYEKDCTRLAALVWQYTDIPSNRVISFLTEHRADEILPCANQICETDTQREKLQALFEFKNLYETMKNTENTHEYTLCSSREAKAYFKDFFVDTADKERLAVAFLDTQGKVISAKIMASGTVNETFVYQRELVKEALFANASSVMLAHNHPAGSLTASNADVTMTNQIIASFETVNIRLLDHIIVAGNEAVSFSENGLLDYNQNLSDTQKVASQIWESTPDDDWENDDEYDDEDEDEDDMGM
jgi:DNA repair protein RadC